MQITPSNLSDITSRIGTSLGFKRRMIFKYRPYICPFHRLIEFVPRDCRLLDAGCGAGLWLMILKDLDRIKSGRGFDVDAASIDVARDLSKDIGGLEFKAVEPDGQWPQGEYDALSMIDVLHHIPAGHKKLFLENIGKLAPKRMIFKDIDPTAFFKKSMNSLHDMVLSQQFTSYARCEDVSDMLIAMGYDITHFERCDMLWYSHYIIIADRK